MQKATGIVVLTLHAHLPYVLSHGRWPHGTDWLNEAAAETYVPLLSMLTDLVAEGLSPSITIGVTPVLTEQLADPAFLEEFRAYLDHRVEAAVADQARFREQNDLNFVEMAVFWERFFRKTRKDFDERFSGNLVGAFKALQDAGHIELITCAATHGYLPLLGRDANVRAQVRVGVESYRHHYGRDPKGIWLPECAYRPGSRWKPPIEDVPGIAEADRAGIEEILGENGLAYFYVDSTLVRGGEPTNAYLARFGELPERWTNFHERARTRSEDAERDIYRLYQIGSANKETSPVAAFTRDPKTGVQVWSGFLGYPGDPEYMDFHKKRFPSGLRYWRVTDATLDLGDKQPYNLDLVMNRVQENASHFCGLVRSILQEHHEQTGLPGVLCAPYDAELFGHWWFEGIHWLEAVIRELANDQTTQLATGSAALRDVPPDESITLPEGSWGEGGYHSVWLNNDTEWTWKLIYEAEVRSDGLIKLARTLSDEPLNRIVTQALRELLLLESSDWQFVISTEHARDYAHVRVNNHYQAFSRLADAAEAYANAGEISPEALSFLVECEKRDGLFPYLELAWFEG